ncbi:hypothetical protein DNTS_023087 [Danionella cerebrum]|uniref:Uncharacterized protein n=1 Tax=Danionella cerebrum TaxID=2873325 RepID=A0A553QSL3_9TELE|nr:hypothetical protein DNTS_023087 [Danionella translucida]
MQFTLPHECSMQGMPSVVFKKGDQQDQEMSSTSKNTSTENMMGLKKHKNKKKKEKKDKKKIKYLPNFLLHDSWHQMNFAQTPEPKKKKKAKKTKPDEDHASQKPKHVHQSQGIICISPDLQFKSHAPKSGKSKKRVAFNLPPDKDQSIRTNEAGKKQIFAESGLESNAAEELNSQDLFITQKSFLEPCVEISSSSSGNEANVSENRKTTEATTQTENFFTLPAHATSFRFKLQREKFSCEVEPVDLSLPTRARRIYRATHSTPTTADPLKISDTSSEEGETPSRNKGDLLQQKVIQTRLNESFFFKVKGEDSPKPLNPLIKLTEIVEKKTKK